MRINNLACLDFRSKGNRVLLHYYDAGVIKFTSTHLHKWLERARERDGGKENQRKVNHPISTTRVK